MAGVFFDSSVYINLLRAGNPSAATTTSRIVSSAANVPLYLSAVVLEEPYAGATDAPTNKLLRRLERDFDKIGRVVVPNRTDWSTAGQILAKIGRAHGFEQVRKSRMTNDCLIAMSARRSGLTVVTHNAVDFRTISEFRPFRFEELTL